ncbi:MAG: site-specific integrase [Muribaculaceae bacterium]|nr:site-specific integrase [Muribaculaceae bacterium]
MASIKVKFRPSTVTEREGTIYYQIIHDRKPRQLLTEYKVFPSEWDNHRAMVVSVAKSNRHTFILALRERIRGDVERLGKIIRQLDNRGLTYTADDVIDEFHRYAREFSLFNFMERVIARLKQNGKDRTSETYNSALRSFKNFRRDEDIMLDCITTGIMEAYESWLHKRKVTPNTISFYMRILRAVYNRAVEAEIIDNRNPFRHVYTGVDKTVKRAIPLSVIKAIIGLELSMTPAIDFARDMFLMSFYLRGMSFIDMAYLKKSDLQNGSVTYRRRKTGQQLIIGWEPEMQKILDKYPENKTDYLLPIITNPVTNERKAYRNKCYNINRNLKKIAKMIGIEVPITLYVARHSWASAAKVKGIPVSVISEGMGHNSETTTQIYLSSLDVSVIDRANNLILKCLQFK